MAHDNVQIVQRLIAAYSEGDLEGVVAATHPQVEIHALRSAIEGPYVGHDGVRRWAAGMHLFGDDFRIEPHEFRQAGDSVVVLGRQRGTSPHGVPVDEALAGLIVFAGRLVRRVQFFPTAWEALEAAGLQE